METITRQRDNGEEGQTTVRCLLGGILGLAVAMGIGRFAYTPIIPAMQAEAGLNHLLAGQIASWNYLGYLLGAIPAGYLVRRVTFRAIYATSLAVSSVSTLAMALTVTPFWWGFLRFVGGMASCITFVVIAARIAAHLDLRGRFGQSSALFSGVGAGISFTGLVTPVFHAAGGWRESWGGVGICAFCLSMVSLYLVGNIRDEGRKTQAAHGQGAPAGTVLLVGAYFLEGLGYIVMATFLVTIVKETPGMAPYSSLSWVVVGLAAALSPFVWRRVSARIGARPALTAAYLLQAGGMYAGIYLAGLAGILVSAITFGGTFMAITSLTLAEGARRGVGRESKVVAILTFAFALGQIIAPPCAGWLAQASGGFGLALKLASGCVLLGGAITWLDRFQTTGGGATGTTAPLAEHVRDYVNERSADMT